MRVCVVGAFDPEYARQAIICAGLEANGVTVDLFPIDTRQQTGQRLRHLWRVFRAVQNYDVVIIPAFNQLTAPVAQGLARLYRKPLLLDYMVGLYDMAIDRGTSNTLRRSLFWMIDWFNTRFITSVTDTGSHRTEFERLLKTSLPRMRVLPVGVQEFSLLPPAALDAPLVQYAGTYIPFHAVEIIIEAAQRLPDVQFELIGGGQTYARTVALVEHLGLQNVSFRHGYFSREDLLAMQARSTIMLGVFGDTDKTRYVVPNKVYEALALGRPLITAESAAVREFLTPGEHLIVVPPADPNALAAAIRALLNDPAGQTRLAQAGRRRIEEAFMPEHIGAQLRTLLEEMCR